ncbi:MAG: T9SS type A sorting domain-containing protein [Bacteroidales bacterium]
MKQNFLLLISLIFMANLNFAQHPASAAERLSPEITVEPQNIEAFHALPERSSLHTITVSNSGDEPLVWQLALQTKTAADAQSDSLPCTEYLYLTGCTVGDGLVYWDLANVALPVIPCSDTACHHNFTGMNHLLYPGENTLTVKAAHDDTWFDVWIDLNKDFILTDDELVLDDAVCQQADTYYNMVIEIPEGTAPTEGHILRFRTNRGGAVTDACETYEYGNCCDFSAAILEGQPAPWLSADVMTGTLPAGESQEIVLTIDSEYLGFGYHGGELIFTSNDPVQPELEIPVFLWVTGLCPLPAPTDMSAYWYEGINLNWGLDDLPGPLHWDNGFNDDGIGLTAGGTFRVASHWEPDQLQDYDGYYIREMQLFPRNQMDATFTLKIWKGPDGDEEIFSQEVTVIPEEWNTFLLEATLPLDAETDLWFGYELTHEGGDYPAGTDIGPAISGFGDMISTTPGEWVSMSAEYGIDCNWNLALTLVADKNGDPGKIPAPTVKPSEVTLNAEVSAGNLPKAAHPGSAEESATLLGFDVYVIEGADTLKLNQELLEEMGFTVYEGEYLDDLFFACAVYEECVSCCAPVSVETGIGEIDADHITVQPNPAGDFADVEADGVIRSLQVLDMNGQQLFASRGNNRQMRIDLSGFAPGVYVIKIETADGIRMKKLVVR